MVKYIVMKKFLSQYLPYFFSVFLILAIIALVITVQGSQKVKAGFTYYATITIDPTKVPNTDQSNFPVLISGTYDGTGGEPDLRTTSNGGNVQNSSGYDIGFYTNSDCTTGKMDWEMESYNAATGGVNYWVRVSTVSSSANTIFYICYGDSAVSSDQSNPTSVWDSNFLGVWHLKEDPTANSCGASKDMCDSTSNGNDAASQNGDSADQSTQVINGGLHFDNDVGEVVERLDVADTAALSSLTAFTLSTWVKLGRDVFTNPIISKGNTAGDKEYRFRLVSDVPDRWNCHLSSNGSNELGGSYALEATTGQWYYAVCTWDGSNINIYVDGSLGVSPAASGTMYDAGVDLVMASYSDGSEYNHALEGDMDEVRISNIARSADWIATEYNNQDSPSTFYSMSSESEVVSEGEVSVRGGADENAEVKIRGAGSGNVNFR